MNFQLSKILKKRNKLFDQLWIRHQGAELVAERLSKFVSDILELMPGVVDRRTILMSVLYLAGKIVDRQNLFDLCWRLAGNIEILLAGKAITPWSFQAADEWVPVQISEADHHRNKYGDKGFLLSFQVMAGTSCPLRIVKFWSNRFCHFVAKSLGFTEQRKEMPFSTGTEFVSLRTNVLIEAERSHEKPFFEKIHDTPACRKWNRDILKLRMRISEPCPYGYTHSCHKCPVGYSSCPAGTHMLTYKQKYCHGCDSDEYFDPTKDDTKCVNCMAAYKLRPRNEETR